MRRMADVCITEFTDPGCPWAYSAEPFQRRLACVRRFSGQLLDDDATLDGAARDAGIEPDELRAWTQGDDVGAALEADMTAACEPLPAAGVLDDKLANWSGGRR
jgi:hypothetical protein